MIIEDNTMEPPRVYKRSEHDYEPITKDEEKYLQLSFDQLNRICNEIAAEMRTEKKRGKLTRNAAQCLKCTKIIESKSVHDYQECGCENNTHVDGGLEYAAGGAIDCKLVKNLCEWVSEAREDDPPLEVRKEKEAKQKENPKLWEYKQSDTHQLYESKYGLPHLLFSSWQAFTKEMKEKQYSVEWWKWYDMRTWLLKNAKNEHVNKILVPDGKEILQLVWLDLDTAVGAQWQMRFQAIIVDREEEPNIREFLRNHLVQNQAL